MTLWPRALQPGDPVQLAAASSSLKPEALERLQAGITVMEQWGLQVQPHPQPLRSWGYLAGNDSERNDDLKATAPLVACLRGGWGAARLLETPAAPWSAASGGTHWLLGFSDVTSLLWARWAAGVPGGIHGPMLTTLAAEPAWSQERLRQLLFGEETTPLSGEVWGGGVAEGPLLVGNLTVATHLLGTALLPSLAGAILVLEDVGEAPYRIERMLTHWRLCGALQQLGGIGFGSFSGCNDDDDPEAAAEQAAGRRFSLEQVLHERTADLGIPVVAGLPVGHEPGNAALPLGRQARLDGNAGRLELLD